MGVRSPEESAVEWTPPRHAGPSRASALGLALGLLVLLLSNGRPIGAGDTRPTEHVAASLVQEGNLDLDEYPEVDSPFARREGVHRVSIYPVLSAVLAAPVFVLARVFFALDETGTAIAGKVAASLFSALAAGLLFLAVGRRRGEVEALWTASLFALATSLWSTSQALWQHPAAVLFLSLAILWILKAEDDPVWAGRAGLPLAAALACRHADCALVAAVAAGILWRWPRRALLFVAWGCPPALFVLAYQWFYFGSPWRHGFTGALSRFSETWGVGHLGLLVSPAKGLLVFTPLVAIAACGLLRVYRHESRWLAGTFGGAVVAHWLLMGQWTEWHGGESWGPRMMTDALPFFFVFLPEGFDAFPRLGWVLATVSLGAQALGAFAYDYRWERLYQRPPLPGHAELWSLTRSPLAHYLGERVLVMALPGVRNGKAFIREHPVMVLGPDGSRVFFEGAKLVVTGVDPTFGAVHLQRGARVEGGRLHLRGHWDGLFLRVLPEARMRRLELRIIGRGQGILYVGERTFWSEPRWSTYPMAGAFRVRHSYHFPESGGGDITVTLGRATGGADLELVGLVPPSDPDNPLRVPVAQGTRQDRSLRTGPLALGWPAWESSLTPGSPRM